MLKFLHRFFGRNSDPASTNPDGIERRTAPRTSAASVLATKPAPQAAVSSTAADEVADDSEESGLSLEEPGPNQPDPVAGVDPYDTGSFNRPNAWNKATKHRND
jgi:hypothetical protein